VAPENERNQTDENTLPQMHGERSSRTYRDPPKNHGGKRARITNRSELDRLVLNAALLRLSAHKSGNEKEADSLRIIINDAPPTVFLFK
jgi:hypothetical protein